MVKKNSSFKYKKFLNYLRGHGGVYKETIAVKFILYHFDKYANKLEGSLEDIIEEFYQFLRVWAKLEEKRDGYISFPVTKSYAKKYIHKAINIITGRTKSVYFSTAALFDPSLMKLWKRFQPLAIKGVKNK